MNRYTYTVTKYTYNITEYITLKNELIYCLCVISDKNDAIHVLYTSKPRRGSKKKSKKCCLASFVNTEIIYEIPEVILCKELKQGYISKNMIERIWGK